MVLKPRKSYSEGVVNICFEVSRVMLLYFLIACTIHSVTTKMMMQHLKILAVSLVKYYKTFL
jgi:hypothetical protein